MRAKIITMLFFALLFTGCIGNSADRGLENPNIVPYKVVTIDNCEYVEVKAGIADQSVYSLTHKGDCKNPIHCRVEEKKK